MISKKKFAQGRQGRFFGFAVFLPAIVLVMLLLSGCQGGNSRTKLLYQGHSSFKVTAKDGTIIYVDPFAGDLYYTPADIILITHQHSDHNRIDKVKQNEDCTVITNAEALKDGKYQSFIVNGIEIEAVEAHNSAHKVNESVGYIITVDGIQIYAAGDTSTTKQMKTFAERGLHYALIPCDGVFNMDGQEAAECASTIGAKHNIPVHTGPFDENNVPELFDRIIADYFDPPNRLLLLPGQEIRLRNK